MFGLFNRPPETKASRALALHFFDLRARWSSRNYDSFSREAYKYNVIAFSAINRLSSAVSSVEWMVSINGKTTTDHPLLDLINRPNPKQSGPAWWRDRIGYLMLSGNLFDERVVFGNKIVELWVPRPDRFSITPSSTGLPSAFEYKVGNKTRIFPADKITGESDILHTKLFNPLDDLFGMSPIEAAAYSVDQHNETSKWLQGLLQNSARPSGALVVDKELGLSEDEYERLKQEIEKQYSGGENAGRPMLLEGGLDWKQMGLSPMDMEILKVKETSARDISLAFGVPPLLLNIPGDNTYANYREARLGFYEDTVLPLIDYLCESFSHWTDPFFPGAVLVPNKDKIEAIAQKREQMWKMADESDDLTLNESRALKGYDPLPDPLGSMLMSEVRKGMQQESPDAVEDQLKKLGYG